MHFRNAFGLLPQYTFQRNFFRSYDLVIESLAIQRQDLIFEHKVVPQGEGVGPVVVNFVLEILASSSDEVPVGVDALRVDETQVGELVHRVHQLVVALLAWTVLSVQVGRVELLLQKLELLVKLTATQFNPVLVQQNVCHLVYVTPVSE